MVEESALQVKICETLRGESTHCASSIEEPYSNTIGMSAESPGRSCRGGFALPVVPFGRWLLRASMPHVGSRGFRDLRRLAKDGHGRVTRPVKVCLVASTSQGGDGDAEVIFWVFQALGERVFCFVIRLCQFRDDYDGSSPSPAAAAACSN